LSRVSLERAAALQSKLTGRLQACRPDRRGGGDRCRGRDCNVDV